MRCLDHVFLRGAMAVALLAFGGTGALLLPQIAPPACRTDAGDTSIAMVSTAAVRAPRVRLVVARAERPLC